MKFLYVWYIIFKNREERNKMKKTLIIILALCIVISVFPFSANAEDKTIKGTVYLDQAPTVGILLGFIKGGDIASVPISSFKVQWQISDAQMSGFNDISGAVSADYTPSGDDFDRYVRVRLALDGYDGFLYSASQRVSKQNNYNVPALPRLTMSDGRLYLIHADVSQEYIISQTAYQYAVTDIAEAEWQNRSVLLTDTKPLDITDKVTPATTVYVYTRYRSTVKRYAGSEVVYSKFYFGESISVCDLALSYKAPGGIVKVGEILMVNVDPMPDDAAGFEGITGGGWLINGSAGPSEYAEFYADKDCTAKLDASVPYKTVYLKLKKAGNGINVSVEKTSDDNRVLKDGFILNVMNEDLSYITSKVNVRELTVAVGDKVENYEISTYPAESDLSGVAIMCDDKYAPLVRFDGDWYFIDVDASDARPGEYKYRFVKDGVIVGSFMITVVSEGDEITYITGDVNGDGAVNNKDVVALFRYVSNSGGAAIVKASSDVNGDGAINNKDVAALFKLIN